MWFFIVLLLIFCLLVDVCGGFGCATVIGLIITGVMCYSYSSEGWVYELFNKDEIKAEQKAERERMEQERLSREKKQQQAIDALNEQKRQIEILEKKKERDSDLASFIREYNIGLWEKIEKFNNEQRTLCMMKKIIQERSVGYDYENLSSYKSVSEKIRCIDDIQLELNRICVHLYASNVANLVAQKFQDLYDIVRDVDLDDLESLKRCRRELEEYTIRNL